MASYAHEQCAPVSLCYAVLCYALISWCFFGAGNRREMVDYLVSLVEMVDSMTAITCQRKKTETDL